MRYHFLRLQTHEDYVDCKYFIAMPILIDLVELIYPLTVDSQMLEVNESSLASCFVRTNGNE